MTARRSYLPLTQPHNPDAPDLDTYLQHTTPHASMSQPGNPNAPTAGQPQRPPHRDMMFCHECADEWYRDEHGLTCPECGSDFTEIIEENNDPRDSVMFADDGDDTISMPDLDQVPPHQHAHHNPWATNDDPDEGDISNVQFTPTGPGRFRVQATVTRSVSPQQLQGGLAPASLGGFMSMLTGLAGAAVGGAARPVGQQPGQEQGAGLFSGPNPSQNQSAFQEAQARSQSPPGQPEFRTSRFTYTGGARLYPRDANNPQPHLEPVDDITNVMTGLMAALGAPPGSVHAQVHHDGGAEGRFHGEHNQNHPEFNHPFFQLFSSMGLLAGGGQMGDFVHSQEGLDRIISQLMEQTATSNAPGPASQSDIDSLPRKKVSEDMLGPEHTAECSICMDEVDVGGEVTVLPCRHWFHHLCISAWLKEHDTCPHCRQGITKRQEGDTNQSSQGAPQTNPTSRMPGAFDDPVVISDDADAAASSSSGDAGSNAGNGGISDRIRRGLFGPQQ
ncbi:hypothetical protein ACN47E_007470 [Coniothyrium glycines]